MFSKSVGLFLAPALVFSLGLVLVGCQAKTECERHYSSGSEQQACVVGAEVVGERVIQNAQGDLPRGVSLGQACEDSCGRRYNPNQVAGNGDERYFNEIANLTRLFVACKDACRVRVEYERNLKTDDGHGCEEIRVTGGIRCY